MDETVSHEQFDLFGNVLPSSLTVEEAATRLGVSSATIRNWLKTDYLKPAGRGRVDIRSITYLQAEILGKAKLTQRANKSFKDSHDHKSIQEYITSQIRNLGRCLSIRT
jgi:site-specific DNA-methyltransferase (adenine-specific)